MTQSNLNNVIQKTTVTDLLDAQSYFNNFYSPNATVSQNVNDSIVGFFETVSETKDGARTLAGSVIMTALSQGLDAMDVLKKFSEIPKGELNAYTAMFLNLNRVGTSYLGITNAPYTNKYVKRLIIA
jgi:hypothetical protein